MTPDSVMRLPVYSVLPTLCAVLENHPRAVLQAAPGAGKTSTVPLALLDAPWVQGRQIWMLEPRRLAAQTAARRLAANLNETRVGETVGLVTREHRLISPQTRIVVLTEGVLTQRLQREPELTQVAAVIFDEFHERSLQADLGLALCRDVQSSLRPDLRLLLMSATLDGEGLAQQIDARMVACPGRQYPLSIAYRAATLEQVLESKLRQLVREIAQKSGGSVLVFLPGEAEIRQAMRALEGSLLPVYPLFARLTAQEQQQALDSEERRVILATAVAETSLTIQGVDTVIDAGWARYPEFDPVAGYSRLVTRRVTRAQADQRAGRAGRTGPGQVWRLWNAEELLAEELAPEIERVDLGRLVLETARWGSADLPWLEPPHAGRWSQARELLEQLAVLDARGALTARGRVMAGWPLEPRWGVLMYLARATDAQTRRRIVDLVSLLSADQPLPREPVDIDSLCDRLAQRALPGPLVRDVERRAKRLERLLGDVPAAAPETPVDLIGALLGAFPDRIAQQRGGRGRFRFSGGGGGRLPEPHPLADAEYLVVLDVDGGREGVIRRALPLSEEQLRQRVADRINTQEQLLFDPQREKVVRTQQSRLGSLVLEERSLPLDQSVDITPVLLAALQGSMWNALPWSEALRQLRARVALLRAAGHALPDCGDEALRADIEHWLAPFLVGVRGLGDLNAALLAQALDYRLGGARREVERLAPASVELNGKRHVLDYTADNAPVLAAPVQWFYGLDAGPCINNGQHPVCLHLLNPARRPLAVTRDLHSFWNNAWREVRGQMRSRYPKHDWPEHPAQAALPERFARQRE